MKTFVFVISSDAIHTTKVNNVNRRLLIYMEYMEIFDK